MASKKLNQQQAYEKGTSYQFIDSIELGPWTSYSLLHDPKHMGFVFARYKFCAKMLEGRASVLEIGCGDAIGAPVVAQAVGHLLGIDPEERLIKGNRKRLAKIKNLSFKRMNICQQIPDDKFDAVFSVDVIEHLDGPLNIPFMKNQCAVLQKDGVCIIGTPNITANKFASARGRVEHINLKSQKALRSQMEKYFKNVFMFGMNDEVVHTGYAPMCHYIFGMGVGVK
jgi:2-polyprenyl-3-methyl-5-hydroxy-6-metoxy-1,4-benzoquinol methylase